MWRTKLIQYYNFKEQIGYLPINVVFFDKWFPWMTN
jgi:hypothetical protein